MENNQQSKLKTKRAKVDSDEESLINTHKLTNKERAKIHRDSGSFQLLIYLGKKKYYEELEQKVEVCTSFSNIHNYIIEVRARN